uniref:Uncharacterized protein n=1 Tax=Chaetoceros debilis TaxID=122233 RepID=A0A7S3QC26_9STRA
MLSRKSNNAMYLFMMIWTMRCLSSSEGAVTSGGDKGGVKKFFKLLPNVNVTMATNVMDLSMTKSIAFVKEAASSMRKILAVGASLPKTFRPNTIAFVKEAADTAFASSASSMRKILAVGASLPKTFRPNTHLITSLQDRILELERHIRSGKEESRQLRALLNEHRNERRRNQSDDVRRSAEVERILSDQMLNLRERIEVLSKSKGEMEQLLKQEKDHVKRLERMIKEQDDAKKFLLKKHEEELEQLRSDILLKSEGQLKEVERDTVAKMKLEIEKIKKESEIALKKERAKYNKIQKDADALLEKERVKSKKMEKERDGFQEAAEKERIKMRKLVKVLAERERKDIANSKASISSIDSGSSSTNTPTIVSAGASGMVNGSSNKKPRNVPNAIAGRKK